MPLKANFYNIIEIKHVCSQNFKKIKEKNDFLKNFKSFMIDNFEDIKTYYHKGDIYIDSFNAFRLNQKLNKQYGVHFNFNKVKAFNLEDTTNIIKLKDVEFELLDNKKMSKIQLEEAIQKKSIAIDFEFYEFETTRILEAGITEINLGKIEVSHQYIIKENKNFVNSKYIKSNPEAFIGNKKADISENELKKTLASYIDEGYIIITFGGVLDHSYLNTLLPDKKMNVYDIQSNIKHKQENKKNTLSLQKAAEAFGLKFEENLYHNAGNDAIITAKIFIEHMKEKTGITKTLNSNQRKRSITI